MPPARTARQAAGRPVARPAAGRRLPAGRPASRSRCSWGPRARAPPRRARCWPAPLCTRSCAWAGSRCARCTATGAPFFGHPNQAPFWLVFVWLRPAVSSCAVQHMSCVHQVQLPPLVSCLHAILVHQVSCAQTLKYLLDVQADGICTSSARRRSTVTCPWWTSRRAAAS